MGDNPTRLSVTQAYVPFLWRCPLTRRAAKKTCLLCGPTSNDFKSRSHAFPEAVYPGGPALPPGIICDKCNNYVGRKLEPVLLGYPIIALPLQMGELPGKRGKPRSRIGIFDRDVVPDAAITFEIEEPEITSDPYAGKKAKFSINPVVDPAFDIGRLRRALHHIGFVLLAIQEGKEVAAQATYDPVRKYIRAPKKNEHWPFWQLVERLDVVIPEIEAKLAEIEDAMVVRLRLLNSEFLLDLRNTGIINRMRITPDDGRARLIGEDWEPNPRKGPDDKRYRVSIY